MEQTPIAKADMGLESGWSGESSSEKIRFPGSSNAVFTLLKAVILGQSSHDARGVASDPERVLDFVQTSLSSLSRYECVE
jgi:hypothetical protein